MPADRDLNGLLYLPDEQLVRSTVEGDAGEWAESLDYVPSEGLVDHVLRRSASLSVRDEPVFRFPLTIERAAWTQRQPIGRKRAASAVAAILGVSPSVLAAATVVHVLAFVTLGHWIFQQVGVAASLPTPVAPAIVVDRVVYFRPHLPPSRGPKKATARRATAAAIAVTRRDSLGSRWTGSRDSLLFLREQEIARRNEQNRRGDTTGFHQEFLLEGNELQPTNEGRMRVGLLIRVLRMWPEARIRILGGGPTLPGQDSSKRGGREAEAFARILLKERIDVGRLELGRIPLADQTCPEREPRCASGRSRVKTEIVRP